MVLSSKTRACMPYISFTLRTPLTFETVVTVPRWRDSCSRSLSGERVTLWCDYVMPIRAFRPTDWTPSFPMRTYQALTTTKWLSFHPTAETPVSCRGWSLPSSPGKYSGTSFRPMGWNTSSLPTGWTPCGSGGTLCPRRLPIPPALSSWPSLLKRQRPDRFPVTLRFSGSRPLASSPPVGRLPRITLRHGQLIPPRQMARCRRS